MAAVRPQTKAPELEVKTAGGGSWKLSERRPDAFTMVVMYRGLHCPICKTYLRELDAKLGDFAELGVEAIAVSGDDSDRAEKTMEEWGLENLKIGYGQSIDNMRDWGLYISKRIKDPEPAKFGEPGLFLVKPNGTVFYAAVTSMPYGRPAIAEMLQSVKYVIDNAYPARGEA